MTTSDMVPPGFDDPSRPPKWHGKILCPIHGEGTFDDGACKECKDLVEQGAYTTCPNHGMLPKVDGIEGCSECNGKPPVPNETFALPADQRPMDVSPKGSKP